MNIVANPQECKVNVFRKGGHLRFYAKERKWYYNGAQMDAVSYYKYLAYNLGNRHYMIFYTTFAEVGYFFKQII